MKSLNHIIRYSIFVFLSSLVMAGCDVHELPELDMKNVPFRLRLKYDTDMVIWNHVYDDNNVSEAGFGETYSNVQTKGQMRYIIRAYPISEKQRTSQNYIKEFVFTRNVADGYDCDYTIGLPAGDYSIMVWSDLVSNGDDTPFYNAGNFEGILLQEKHIGNTDYRDAYRGRNTISLSPDIYEHIKNTLKIEMKRPLAKYEFITTDLEEFIEKEIARIAVARGEKTDQSDNSSSRVIDVSDYSVVFYYTGFMHNEFDMYEDRPSDVNTNVSFESKITKISDNEASLGFDYIFVNGSKTSVMVQIAIFNKEGERLSLTEEIGVPLYRNHHTKLRGSFLMQNAQGGVHINPEFEGDILHKIN